ncbi:FKBP-type peptidylprolyl isomerase [Flavobacterium sp.]|uniref:FKBP-type peptidylprolyl isomerase n=1 Tax=Flavobacterium sp. TaxID=239 RepID=UPI00286C80E1|nr:FKBP-type peptidylprolyl isomerase [Flavobacterium sp.]
MNKFKFYFFLFCSVIILFSCNKADSISEVPIRDFDVQYQDDNAIIEDYLKTYYIPVDFDPNQDVTIKKIDAGQPSIWTWLRDAEDTNATYPQLLKKPVVIDDTTYNIYYLKLRANLETGIAPSRVDAVLTSYKGAYLSYTTETVNTVSVTTLNATPFEYTPFPTAMQTLDRSIRGWAEIFPFFKAGTKDPDVVGQPTTYSDFGAGVVFIPSGFAYFNQGRTSPLSGVLLPSYSPLVFSFKLYKAEAADQDEDGILSNDEDLNGDDLFDKDHDDTDGDGFINMYDTDDDGDGYYTKNEIHKNADGSIIFEDTDGDGIPNYLDVDNH